ncbi:hypothetical protein VPH35_109916 [Triticum aestivum]
MASYSPPPPYVHTDGGAGEEQLQSWWGAAATEMKEVRRPCLSPCCILCYRSSLLPSPLAAQQSGTRGRSRSTRIHLSARGLEEQVARETGTVSGGAAQGRPPPVFCPISDSLPFKCVIFPLGPIFSHVWGLVL